MKLVDGLFLVGSEQFGLSHPLDCNCYLIDTDSGLVLIDPGRGFGVDDIERNIRADGFDPAAIEVVLVTHSHDGHTGACRAFKDRYGAEVWVPRGAESILAEGSDPGIVYNLRRGLYPSGWSFPTVNADRVLDDGEAIEFGGATLSAIAVQGHTPDSMCFLWEIAGRRVLVTGDVVFFFGRIGLLNLEGCSIAEYRRDIGKLAGLDTDVLCPGHGIFTLTRGQWHVDRAIRSLSHLTLPESYFETTEFRSEDGDA